MGLRTKEACQDAYVLPKVYTLSNMPHGLTLADMEALFGRLARSDSTTGGDRNTFIVESEDQERTRVFNFTDYPLTQVGQDGICTLIPTRDPRVFTPFILPTQKSTTGYNTEAWWTALTKTQENSDDLLNKIVILRSRFFTGHTLNEIHHQLRQSTLDKTTQQVLLNSQPFSAYYCGKRIVAIYAMFMYVLDVNDFCGYAHLHERTSGMFLSLKSPQEAPAHPFDVSNDIADNRGADQADMNKPPVWITHRMVYHTHMPRTRYINDGGVVIQIVPERDTTTQEGYYKVVVHARKLSGVPGSVDRIFTPLEKLTEDGGFYYSNDAAKENISRVCSEKLAIAHQTSQEALFKGWLAQMQADAKLAASVAKEHLAAQVQVTRENLTKNADTCKGYCDDLIKENANLREKLKTANADYNDSKRHHEKDMQDRKEQLELLKLIPAAIAIIAAVLAVTKGKKK